MHALLLAADAALAEEIAAAWRAGAAGSVDAATLPTPPPTGAPAARGVFVPLGSLGLTVASGSVSPAEARLQELAAGADVVVVHLDVLDGPALHEGALPLVARVAGERAVPVVVLAGRSEASRREWSAAGVSGVHEVGPVGGTGSAADERAARAASVGRAARTWAPPWEQRAHAP